ncbi:MAG: nitrogen fixation protein NifQ [Methylococcales bacterium]|nr:nitrogen fixation protein NifQ [Methylococcales bacterium]MDP3839242.1 nitrogen fixation protein NifQ [Methylococcales bacterium]
MTLQHADRETIYSQLTQHTISDANHEWLACMVASWCVGNSLLPDYLGLECHDFAALKQHYFADYPLPERAPSGKQLDFERMLERQDLINLLKHYSRPEIVEIDWVIGLLVAGCLGNDHLWHDLGLWSRSQLTALLHYNFPALAARNTHDMKWKKFLYKQLCEEEGLYLCRAPSCQVCVDYGQCYGSEETITDTHDSAALI